MDFLNQHPFKEAIERSVQVSIIGLPAGGYVIRVGSGASAAYYLQGTTPVANRLDIEAFNVHQFRYLFS